MRKILSPASKNVLAPERKLNLTEQIDIKRKYFFTDQAYSTIDSYNVYENEMDESDKYRLSIDVSIYSSNVLINPTGQDSYDNVLQSMNFIEEDNNFEFSQSEILKNLNGQFYYIEPDSNDCEQNYLRPYPDDFLLFSKTGFQNYDISLYYAAQKDNDFELNAIPLSDGIAVFSSSTVSFSDRPMTKIISNIPHNLSQNDIVKIDGDINYIVYKTGDENNDNTSHIFLIDDEITASRYQKMNGSTPCEYYVRKLKKIDCKFNVYNAGFSTNIFKQKNFTITSSDVDVKGLKDCFLKNVNELYVGFIKKRSASYSANAFTTPIAGIDNLIANTQYDSTTINLINNGFIDIVSPQDELYFYDIVEIDNIAQTITSLIDVRHVFNAQNRQDNQYYESYFHRPFYPIKIRKFSDFIDEDSFQFTDSAFRLHGSRYIDRPLLNKSKALLHPFVNGFHNVQSNIDMFVQRQDACNQFINFGEFNFIEGQCKDYSRQEAKLNFEC